jgi:hypothetical protein
MKAQKRNRRGLQKRNNRWKWMVGATAAGSGGVTTSHASLITINLVGNFISATDGNHLNADLTGDGHPDLTIAHATLFYTHSHTTYDRHREIHATAGVYLNGIRAKGYGYVLYTAPPFPPYIVSRYYAQLGSRRTETQEQGGFAGYVHLTGSIPIFFKDLHINGGAPTRGTLEITVTGGLGGSHQVQLDSVTYNSNLPDQGSSLALLAMGAGGILALRRWRTAQRGS